MFDDCVQRFGEEAIPKLLEFVFLEDWSSRENPHLAEKARRYDSLARFQINANFTPLQVRELTLFAYDVFLHPGQFEKLRRDEMIRAVAKILN